MKRRHEMNRLTQAQTKTKLDNGRFAMSENSESKTISHVNMIEKKNKRIQRKQKVYYG